MGKILTRTCVGAKERRRDRSLVIQRRRIGTSEIPSLFYRKFQSFCHVFTWVPTGPMGGVAVRIGRSGG